MRKRWLKFAVCMLLLVNAPTMFALEVGKPAPAFNLASIVFKGATVSKSATVNLSDFKGKVVYIDFWASWCAPCRKSLPQLDQLRASIAPQGFEVLAISLDETTDDALGFLQQFPLKFPVLFDARNADEEPIVATAYGVANEGLPSGFILDRSGIVRYIHHGYDENSHALIQKQVNDLLSSPVR